MEKILLDSSGHFQWASIAALVAFSVGVITAWASIFNTKKSIKATVVSKARIEWIQDPDKGKNELIVYMVSILTSHITNEDGFTELNPKFVRNFVHILRDFLRIYFKAEWKRANGEIKDSELQSYLEKQSNYKEIMEILKNPLANYQEYIENLYLSFKKEYK